jgi:hypothetical protein
MIQRVDEVILVGLDQVCGLHGHRMPPRLV